MRCPESPSLFWLVAAALLSCCGCGAAASQQQQERHTIVGGVPVPNHLLAIDYGWFTRLEFEGSFGCAGSAIHPEFILTAAHCLDHGVPAQDIRAVVGGYNWTSTNRGRAIQNFWLHPAYQDEGNVYDVGLVQLKKPLEDTVPLVAVATNRDVVQTGDPVVVVGMGVTDDSTTEDATTLQQTTSVQVLDDDVCRYVYGDFQRISMICAGHVNPDDLQGPCYHDSGGPLLKAVNQTDTTATTLQASATTFPQQKFVQVGVVSYGGEICGHPEQPGVYADVAKAQEWINNMICSHATILSPAFECNNDTADRPWDSEGANSTQDSDVDDNNNDTVGGESKANCWPLCWWTLLVWLSMAWKSTWFGV